jgi:hypothetical protein
VAFALVTDYVLKFAHVTLLYMMDEPLVQGYGEMFIAAARDSVLLSIFLKVVRLISG